MRKIFVALIISLLVCSSLNGEDYDIAGQWNLKGSGHVDKGVVRSSLALNGKLNIYTASTPEILANTTSRDLVDENLLSGDLRFITGYDIYLRIDATTLGIKVYDDNIPNGIRIPVPLPEMRPTVNEPYSLPPVTYDNLTYTVKFTSIYSGTVEIRGVIDDIDVINSVELDSECITWKEGTPEPHIDEEKDSGCNSGIGIISLALIFMEVLRFVRH